MIKKGYKVTSSQLTSVIQLSVGTTLYSRDESATPKLGCGPLTVFKNLEAAMYFKRAVAGRGVRIFTCYYLPTLISFVWINKRNLVSIGLLYEQNTISILPNSVDLAHELILGEEVG